jgi:MFS family permease
MNPDFRKLVCARFFFTFAVQMQSVVLGWRIYELLKDPLALGMIGLAEAVPAIGLALYAGYLVDRMAPLKVYRNVIFVSLLSGVLVLSEHVLDDKLNLFTQAAMLYSASVLTGVARAFSQPSIFASVPRIVGRATLLRATALMSSAMQVARIGGPAFGGLVFGFFGAIAASGIVCLFLLFAVASMAVMKLVLPPPSSFHQHASIKDELLSGGRFVFNHPVLFPALTLDMISVMFGGVTALLPIFAEDILAVGPKGLGILRAAPAVGATLMSFYQSRATYRGGRKGKTFLTAVGGFGLCILVFGLSRNFYLSIFALLMSGVFDSVSMVTRSSAVQLFSPDHMRGKISAVNSIFIGSSNEIGELESGIAAKLIGTVPAVYLGGVVCLLTVAAAAYFSPALRPLDLEELARLRGPVQKI